MSMTVKLRRQGGAAIMTVPANIVQAMHLSTGVELALEFTGAEFVVRPAKPAKKPLPRRTLAELLVGSEYAAEVMAETSWALEGDPVGREVA
jgi:antitoxin ChpS